jgi:1-acyl-sn-glycerol-3-phosphate acyltransferase
MIPARKQVPAEWLFTRYLKYLYRKHFRALRLLGEIPRCDPNVPVLIAPNHNTWWDGFFVYTLNEELLRRRLYMMMLAEQLTRYRFFSRLGAYGIRPGSRDSVLQGITYTADLLRQSKSAVCIFPQGELTAFGTELNFQRGLEWILKRYKGQVDLIPLAMRCEFLQDRQAEVFFLFDQVHRVTDKTFGGTKWLQEREQILLDTLVKAIRAGSEGKVLGQG